MAVSTVKVTINSQVYDLTFNSSTNKWEATISAPSITSYNVNAGHYYPVQVSATDDAGNTTTKDDTDGTLGASLKLLVKEKTKPIAVITSPGTGAKLTSSSPTVTFTLRDEANGSGIKVSSLSLKIDGGTPVGNTATGMTCTQVTGGYDCSYVIQTALAEGGHTIAISIADNDGNVSTTVSTAFTVDTVPPVLNVTAPSEGFKTNNSSLTVTGNTNDVTSSPVTVTIKLNAVDQGTVTVTDGNFSKSLTLANGANVIVIKSTDSSGKYSEVTRNVTLDTVAPTISAVALTPNPADCGQTIIVSVTVAD